MARRIPEFCNAHGRNGARGRAAHGRGKLFAGVYALYAGLVFLVVAGFIFAPVVHRVMHKFHWEQSP